MAGYEERLLKTADHFGHRMLNGIQLADFELLARLRHHGAATRLMDASRNALVALWFAATDQLGEAGALFGFHSSYLNGYERETEKRPYREVIDELDEDYIVLVTWEPPSWSSPRITAQSSQYLYSQVVESPTGSLNIPSEADALLVIAISPTLKRKVLEHLEKAFDITRYTMFPDIEGFSSANAWQSDPFSGDRW